MRLPRHPLQRSDPLQHLPLIPRKQLQPCLRILDIKRVLRHVHRAAALLLLLTIVPLLRLGRVLPVGAEERVRIRRRVEDGRDLPRELRALGGLAGRGGGDRGRAGARARGARDGRGGERLGAALDGFAGLPPEYARQLRLDRRALRRDLQAAQLGMRILLVGLLVLQRCFGVRGEVESLPVVPRRTLDLEVGVDEEDVVDCEL